jgi:ribosomal protein S19E (S16A)
MRFFRTGASMSQEALALLRSLAMRPHQVATTHHSILEDLKKDGFVASTPSGWSATAKGCEILEDDRSKQLASRNDQ